MNRKNWLALILMLVVGVGIFAFSLRNTDLHQLLIDLLALNWGWFAIAIVCIGLYLGLEGVVVKLFMKDSYPSFSWKDAMRMPLIEQLFNGITPFSSGGQPAQIIAMLQSGVDGGRASSVLLMKFVVFQAMIVINFIVSLIMGFHLISTKLQGLTLFVVIGFIIHFAVIVGLLMIMYWYQMTKRLTNWVIKPLRLFMKPERYAPIAVTLNEKIDTFYKESVKMKKQYRKLAKVSVVTLLQLFFYYAIPYFILRALGVSGLNFWMILSLHVIIFMVTSVFPIPGGTGGAEYGFVVLFAGYVQSNSKLVLAMLLWRILTYYVGLFAGMFALVIKADKVSEID